MGRRSWRRSCFTEPAYECSSVIHARDLRRGGGRVDIPGALARKYPNASREWRWQYVFPATRTHIDVVTRELRRHHLHVTVIQRAVAEAVRAAGLMKRGPATHSATPLRLT